MLAHPTLDQLHALGLHGLAKGFKDLELKPEARGLEHAEWLGLLLEYETTLRRQKQFEFPMTVFIPELELAVIPMVAQDVSDEGNAGCAGRPFTPRRLVALSVNQLSGSENGNNAEQLQKLTNRKDSNAAVPFEEHADRGVIQRQRGPA